MKAPLFGPTKVESVSGSFYLPSNQPVVYVGSIHTCFYMANGDFLEHETYRADGTDAYWVNGHRVFKAVWERYYGPST